jgi:hypothetical protein
MGMGIGLDVTGSPQGSAGARIACRSSGPSGEPRSAPPERQRHHHPRETRPSYSSSFLFSYSLGTLQENHSGSAIRTSEQHEGSRRSYHPFRRSLHMHGWRRPSISRSYQCFVRRY